MLSKIRVGTKLVGGFALVALLCVFMAYRGISSLSMVEALSVELSQHLVPAVDALGVINESKLAVQREERTAILLSETGNVAGLAKCRSKLTEKWGLIDEAWKKYEALPLTAEEKGILRQLATDRGQWQAQHEKVMALVDAHNAPAALKHSLGPTQTSYKAFMDTIDRLIAINSAQQASNRINMRETHKHAVAALLSACLLCIVLAVGLGIYLTVSITRPLKQMDTAARRIAEGDINQLITYASRDEVGQMADSFRAVTAYIGEVSAAAAALAEGDLSAEPTARSAKDVLSINMGRAIAAVRNVIADTDLLSQAAVEGNLATRADAGRHKGDYGRLVQGMNNTLDAVIGPLNVAADYVDRISKGSIPERITDDYNGDFNAIKINLNTCIDALNGLLDGSAEMARQHELGMIDYAMPEAEFTGAFAEMAGRINGLVQTQVGISMKVIETVSSYAEGDLSLDMDPLPGMLALFTESVNGIKVNLSALSQEVNRIMEAAKTGDLSVRGEASRHCGEFARIVQGMNDTLDNFAEKSHWYETLLDAIPFPVSVTDLEMNWTFINSPVEQFLGMKRADVVGRHCSEWNASICNTENCGVACLRRGQMRTAFAQQGHEFQVDSAYLHNMKGERVGHIEVVQDTTSISRMLDFQRVHIDRASNCLAKLAGGDTAANVAVDAADEFTADTHAAFVEIAERIGDVRNAVASLVSDAEMLTAAAVAGKLDARADVSKHQGDYRKIVQGVNDTLDAVIDPINEAAAVMERVADKDMTARVVGNYNGDLAKIKNAINTAVENLDEGLHQVAIGAEQVASASVEISTGSQTLSQGSSEQAASLEEISSSLQEMSSMTRQNATNAQEARGLAESARASSDQGVSKMERLSEAVDKIKTSSDQTAKIVKTIDEIAFQTNLLALNAAVEAARAGDAGKGFAVVAEEVRNLAMRSAEAAKNTANLIEESVHNAQGGVAINQEVLVNLREINQQVNKVTEVMSEIALSSEQQNQGIEQVATAVGEMDHLTQQNAANSEESASASEELSSQAEEMMSMVAGFQLTGSTSTSGVKAVRDRRSRDRSVSEGGSRGAGARAHAPGIDPATAIPFDDDADVGTLSTF